MRRIGLTGGIGSGKSTVSSIFKTLGIPVFEADVVSKSLLASDPDVIAKVKRLLGDDVYKDGAPDRPAIAKIVFSDESKLESLNGILHPAVFNAFEHWVDDHKNKAPYCLKEAAILFESGSAQQCDKVICVAAPLQLRVERVMQRDGVSARDVESRIQNQMPQEQVEKLSDLVIQNDGVEALIPQVISIHNALSKRH